MEVERGRLTVPESRPKPRWYHVTPDRLIVGLLAVEGFLLLSEQFQWFAFNEKKGWTVLIAMAAVCLVVVVMLLWLVVSLLSRLRFQFSLRSLVVLVVAVAVPLGWFGVKLREAERQRRVVEAIRKAEAGGEVGYDCQYYQFEESRPTLAWLRRLVGIDFFANVVSISVHYPEKRDDALLGNYVALTSPDRLFLSHSQVTDGGLEHLKGLTNFEHVDLYDTHVTEEGIKELQEALPNCKIDWRGVDHDFAKCWRCRFETPPSPTPKTNLDQP